MPLAKSTAVGWPDIPYEKERTMHARHGRKAWGLNRLQLLLMAVGFGNVAIGLFRLIESVQPALLVKLVRQVASNGSW